MKIAYYCQHVLGIGHYYRSLELCRACSTHHETTMIVGGPPVDVSNVPFSFLQLPGLKMDDDFRGLIPCEDGVSLEEIKEERQKHLLSFMKTTSPDCLIIELYPFGRKAFRFELDPLIEIGRNTSCHIVCSLRDILVEKKQDQDMYEKRAVSTLNQQFDALLVHADSRIVGLDETFSLIEMVQVPIQYTGFVTPRPDPQARSTIRKKLGLGDEHKLIVASIGSGSVGSQLLESVLTAAQQLESHEACHFQIFAGPYCDESVYQRLRAGRSQRVSVERFSNHFIDWLAAADLSISMAGYNTCMNTLAAGVPALMLPFEQNREQRLRIEKLTDSGSIHMLEPEDLAAEQLAQAILYHSSMGRYTTRIDLNGAVNTLKFIETLQ